MESLETDDDPTPLTPRELLSIRPGTTVTVRYRSVYGNVGNETELTATVSDVETRHSRGAEATWITIYLDPADGHRDRRDDYYKGQSRPPRRLDGVVMDEGDTHAITLECRNGGRWNRLSTGLDPDVVPEVGEDSEGDA